MRVASQARRPGATGYSSLPLFGPRHRQPPASRHSFRPRHRQPLMSCMDSRSSLTPAFRRLNNGTLANPPTSSRVKAVTSTTCPGSWCPNANLEVYSVLLEELLTFTSSYRPSQQAIDPAFQPASDHDFVFVPGPELDFNPEIMSGPIPDWMLAPPEVPMETAQEDQGFVPESTPPPLPGVSMEMTYEDQSQMQPPMQPPLQPPLQPQTRPQMQQPMEPNMHSLQQMQMGGSSVQPHYPPYEPEHGFVPHSCDLGLGYPFAGE